MITAATICQAERSIWGATDNNQEVLGIIEPPHGIRRAHWQHIFLRQMIMVIILFHMFGDLLLIQPHSGNKITWRLYHSLFPVVLPYSMVFMLLSLGTDRPTLKSYTTSYLVTLTNIASGTVG
jgi:hypothetical protein